MLLKLDGVLDAAKISEIRNVLDSAKFAESRGGPDGEVRNNLTAESGDSLTPAIQAVVTALMAREDFTAYALPHHITLQFNRYDTGMSFGDHCDAPLIGSQRPGLRADLAFTLFLSDPESYEGGELAIDAPSGTMRVKEPAGTVVVYAPDRLHRVEPVTGGTRLAAIGWVQSLLRDEGERRIAAELATLRSAAEEAAPDGDLGARIGRLHGALLRRWADV